jgi:hypothetical protein
MTAKKQPQLNGQINLPLKHDRCVAPERAAQILASALGHGYSRQSVYRLIESGDLKSHRVRRAGRIWVEVDSILELISKTLNDPAI